MRPAAVLAAGAAAAAAFLIAPSGSVLQTAAFCLPFVLSVVLLSARVRTSPPEARDTLRLLWAAAGLYLIALMVWYVGPVHFGAVLPFPSPLDAMFFLAYLLYGGFLLKAARARAQDSRLANRLAVTDTAILTLALSALLWDTVIAPQLTGATAVLPAVVALLYPAFQLMLFALTARVVIGHRIAGQSAGILLLAWIGAELAGNVLYSIQSANGTFRYDTPLTLTWMLGYTALAAFTAHPALLSLLQPGCPGPESPTVPSTTRTLPRGFRLSVLFVAAVVPLVLAAFTRGHDPALMAAAAVTFALGLYRASLIAGDLAEQRRLGAELAAALAVLSDQHSELSRLAAVVSSTRDAVVTYSPDGFVLDWNHGAERMYGYTHDEVVGVHATAYQSSDDQLGFEATLRQVIAHGYAQVSGMALSKDGSSVEIEASLSAVRSDAGDIVAVVAISRDVTERNELQRQRAAHTERLDEAQRIAGVGSWDWNLVTDEVTCSEQLYRTVGLYAQDSSPLQHLLSQFHPDDLPAVEQHFAAALNGCGSLQYEARMVRPDGEIRWISVHGEMHLDDRTGAPARMTGTVQDVTERMRLQYDLVDHAQRLNEAQRLAAVGSFERDLATDREVWSSEYYRIMGVEPGTEASHSAYLDRVHPLDRTCAEEQGALVDDGGTLEYETRIVRPDGEVRWIAVRREVRSPSNGVAAVQAGTVHDITDRKAAEAELERLALTDNLTGLSNRVRFTQVLRSALDDGDAEHGVGLLLLDLDGFKDVNDGLGHHAGDLALQEVARRLTATLRDGDEVARLGGDEFAVVLRDLPRVDDAVVVATKIQDCLQRPFDLEGMTVHVGASIGIVHSDSGGDAGTLLKHADVAMYRAKTLTSRCAVFEPDEDDLAAGRLAMVTDLRAAIEEGTLDVAYQPIVDVATRRVTSFEALARWTHPDRGFIPPDQFIPLAEQADLIVPLTRLVLRKASAACAAWRSAGHDVRIGVNLSVQVIENSDAPGLVAAELAQAGLDPQHLILEITESSLATEGERVKEVLRSLRDLGLTLVIDDFGTGYSAMSYLKELPVAELKIDRSFVRDIATDSRDLAIVRSLIRLAHSLSLRVVAEGVESAPALEVLAALGCDFAQGYGIARPMPEQDTCGWLARHVQPAAGTTVRAEPRELLVVDDSATVRAHLVALTTAAGWRVREAASAEEAIVEVERSIPDVVILDHFMTGMSGVESVPALRARGLDGPILLFTQFLSEAFPSMRVPLDVWPVSKSNPDAVIELLANYRRSMSDDDGGRAGHPGHEPEPLLPARREQDRQFAIEGSSLR